MGCARAGHSTEQGTRVPRARSAPELQPDVVGGVSADLRCLARYSLLHPKLRGKMSFPHVVPSTSPPLLSPFSAFPPVSAADSPFQSSPKTAQLFRGRVPVLVHSLVSLSVQGSLISAPLGTGLQHQL